MQHSASKTIRHSSGYMNKRLWVLIAVLSFLFIVSVFIGLRLQNAAPADPSRIPQLTGMTLDSRQISLSDLRGQVVMLNFWATWCPPCRGEMPTIQSAYETYHDRGFTVLAINASESPEAVRAFVDRMGLTFPVVLDPRAVIQRQFLVDSFPTSLLIDPGGVLYASHGGALTADQIASTIEQGLAHAQ